MNYTILAYKASYSNYCGDFFNSDFEHASFNDIDSAINFTADYYYKGLREGNDHYYVTILYDGKERYAHWDIGYDDLPDIHNPAVEIAEQKYNNYSLIIQQEQQQAEDARKEFQRQKDMKTLKELKEKYGE